MPLDADSAIGIFEKKEITIKKAERTSNAIKEGETITIKQLVKNDAVFKALIEAIFEEIKTNMDITITPKTLMGNMGAPITGTASKTLGDIEIQ